MIAILNLTLLWLFVSRLQRLSLPDFDTLIEKSTVVCIAGLLSTLAGFTIMGLTGNLTVIVFDLFFNTLLLYCLFDFGTDIYSWMFGPLVKRLQSWLAGQNPPPMPMTMTNQNRCASNTESRVATPTISLNETEIR